MWKNIFFHILASCGFRWLLCCIHARRIETPRLGTLFISMEYVHHDNGLRLTLCKDLELVKLLPVESVWTMAAMIRINGFCPAFIR